MTSPSTPTVHDLKGGGAAPSLAGGQKILDRYRLVRVLGCGGMGVVWLARDEKLDRDIALKFLPALVVNDRASLDDLKRETRRSLELTHPNIVRTYDFVQDSTVAGISMEYVDFDTLRNLRVDQPGGVFQTGQLGDWTRQLCGALDYAHQHAAIVHRDLKPANLMVNSRAQLKVTDFGIARSLVESVTQMTHHGGVSGTLVYMSPQQLSGETASALDDIYAVGATLYDLLTTRPPFYTGDINAQIHQKTAPPMAERRASLGLAEGEIPENWETTIAQCLAKDPAQRPHSAGEIAAGLGLSPSASVRHAAPPALPMASMPGTRTGSAGPGPGSFNSAVIQTQVAPAPAPSTHYTEATVIAPPPPFFTKKKMALLGGGFAFLGFLILAVAASVYALLAGSGGRPGGHKPAAGEQITPVLIAPAPPAPAPITPGGLVVKTEPSGASVRIEGQPAAISPAVFQELAPGPHTLEIALEGFDPITRKVEVGSGRVAELDGIVLQRSKGALELSAEPRDLAYELKNLANPLEVSKGQLPFRAAALPVGEYEATVTPPGWPAQRQRFVVRKGEEQHGRFEFAGGRVTINSEPPGAKVSAGGRELGVTPLVLEDVAPGAVQYVVQLPKYDKAVLDGVVSPSNELVLSSPLAKTPTSAVGASTSKARSPSNSGQRRTEEARPSIGRRMKDGFTDRFIHGMF